MEMFLPFVISLVESGLRNPSDLYEFSSKYFENLVLTRKDAQTKNLPESKNNEIKPKRKVQTKSNGPVPDFCYDSVFELYPSKNEDIDNQNLEGLQPQNEKGNQRSKTHQQMQPIPYQENQEIYDESSTLENILDFRDQPVLPEIAPLPLNAFDLKTIVLGIPMQYNHVEPMRQFDFTQNEGLLTPQTTSHNMKLSDIMSNEANEAVPSKVRQILSFLPEYVTTLTVVLDSLLENHTRVSQLNEIENHARTNDCGTQTDLQKPTGFICFRNALRASRDIVNNIRIEILARHSNMVGSKSRETNNLIWNSKTDTIDLSLKSVLQKLDKCLDNTRKEVDDAKHLPGCLTNISGENFKSYSPLKTFNSDESISTTENFKNPFFDIHKSEFLPPEREKKAKNKRLPLWHKISNSIGNTVKERWFCRNSLQNESKNASCLIFV